MGSRMIAINDLITVDGIAKRKHMSVASVSNIVTGRDGRKKSNFPQPICGRGTRAVWLWPDVDEWFTENPPKSKLQEHQTPKRRKSSYVNNSQPLSA